MENVQIITERILDRVQCQNKEPKYTCLICKDKGFIDWEDEAGYLFSKECECQIRAREREKTKRHIRESNLMDVLKQMTFKNYKQDTKGNEIIKARAIEYLESDSWWFIGGKIGTGKTHITTAICGELIKRGKAVYYMNWKSESTSLKVSMTKPDYSDRLKRLCTVEVLYIDDLFKGTVSMADKDLLFMIIDTRYSRNLKTLISAEKNFQQLREIDEAIASRIKQKTRDCYLIEVSSLENYRYRAKEIESE